MRLLLDTNGYKDFCMGERRAVDLLQRADEIHLPFVTLAELRAGICLWHRGAPQRGGAGSFSQQSPGAGGLGQ
jgi:predicted nucleic acid-binding protein